MYGRFAEAEQAAAPQLANAAAAVLISASVSQELGFSELHYAWVYPTGVMSQNMLGKWDELLAQPYQENLADPNVVTYHLRLLGSGGSTLADFTLTPSSIDPHSGETYTLTFLQTFAAPAGVVARLNLMADSTAGERSWLTAGVLKSHAGGGDVRDR
jgi:hypothetical protein